MNLENILRMPRCPHCFVDTPSLPTVSTHDTTNSEGKNKRAWRVYACTRCGGLVMASAFGIGMNVLQVFPGTRQVDTNVPTKARSLLQQAIESINTPAPSVMTSASAIDAMLKVKGYIKGSLFSRIEEAIQNHLITPEMGEWAHDVRLDGNDQRHADENADLPTMADAERCVEFAQALAEFLFVLPARVQRGLQASQKQSPAHKNVTAVKAAAAASPQSP